MKRPQTKFHADTMSHSKVIGSKKVRIYHYVKIYWQVEIFLQQSFSRYPYFIKVTTRGGSRPGV